MLLTTYLTKIRHFNNKKYVLLDQETKILSTDYHQDPGKITILCTFKKQKIPKKETVVTQTRIFQEKYITYHKKYNTSNSLPIREFQEKVDNLPHSK